MFYRLTLQCNFTSPPPESWLLAIRQYIRDNAITINPGVLTEQRSHYTAERCHHDETPPQPCQVIDTWHSD